MKLKISLLNFLSFILMYKNHATKVKFGIQYSIEYSLKQVHNFLSLLNKVYNISESHLQYSFTRTLI